MQYNTVQYSTIQYNTIQYNNILYYTIICVEGRVWAKGTITPHPNPPPPFAINFSIFPSPHTDTRFNWNEHGGPLMFLWCFGVFDRKTLFSAVFGLYSVTKRPSKKYWDKFLKMRLKRLLYFALWWTKAQFN